MSKTGSRAALLQVCIQDLYAGRRRAAKRLGRIASHAGPALTSAIDKIARCCAKEAVSFERSDCDLNGPDNIWMTGILDDAERDTRSVEAGPLLDIALIGAVRKALAADFVSLETALVLARQLGRQNLAELIEAMHERARHSDYELRQLLFASEA